MARKRSGVGTCHRTSHRTVQWAFDSWVFEKSYIQGLLRVCRGNISKAARLAQKNRRAFWQLIQKYKIDVRYLNDSNRVLHVRGCAPGSGVRGNRNQVEGGKASDTGV